MVLSAVMRELGAQGDDGPRDQWRYRDDIGEDIVEGGNVIEAAEDDLQVYEFYRHWSGGAGIVVAASLRKGENVRLEFVEPVRGDGPDPEDERR